MKKHISLVGTVTVGPKGQVVIPAEVREKMNIEPGDKLVALYLEDKQAVGFITEAHAQLMVEHMGKNLKAMQQIVGKAEQ